LVFLRDVLRQNNYIDWQIHKSSTVVRILVNWTIIQAQSPSCPMQCLYSIQSAAGPTQHQVCGHASQESI
jgi:hypothetical protein